MGLSLMWTTGPGCDFEDLRGSRKREKGRGGGHAKRNITVSRGQCGGQQQQQQHHHGNRDREKHGGGSGEWRSLV